MVFDHWAEVMVLAGVIGFAVTTPTAAVQYVLECADPKVRWKRQAGHWLIRAGFTVSLAAVSVGLVVVSLSGR